MSQQWEARVARQEVLDDKLNRRARRPQTFLEVFGVRQPLTYLERSILRAGLEYVIDIAPQSVRVRHGAPTPPSKNNIRQVARELLIFLVTGRESSTTPDDLRAWRQRARARADEQ